MTVDFGRTARDYAAYRVGFPDELFGRLSALGACSAGQKVLDLGTGTGALARGFAQRGLHATGLDPADALLAEARRLDADAGVQVDYRVGRAESTGLQTGAFDVVSAGQCWHWFDAPRAATEIRRLLRPGGALVVCSLDYLVLPGNVCAATEELILARNPGWRWAGGCGIHPRWVHDADLAGFERLESFSFDLVIPFTHEAWRGRIRACNGVGASLPDRAVADFDAALADLLADAFRSEPLEVLHRVWALVARSPSPR